MCSTPARLSIALALASLIISFSITSAQQPAPAEPVSSPALQVSSAQVQNPPPRQVPGPVLIPPVAPQTAPDACESWEMNGRKVKIEFRN